MNERYMTAKTLAEMLQLSEEQVYRLAAAGTIPSYKIGGARRFRESDIEAWLQSCKSGPDDGGAVVPLGDRR